VTFFLAAVVTAMLNNLTSTVVDGVPNITASFGAYQRSRSTCVVQMIKLQAAAWCLSCDPAYASKGVTSSGVQLSNNLCNRLQSSCYEFVSRSASQSVVLYVKSLSSWLQSMSASLRKIAQNDITGLADLGTISAAVYNSNTSKNESPVSMPNGCTGIGSCSWICTDLFSQGQVNETLMGLGGQVDGSTSTSTSSRLLQEEITEGSVVKDKLLRKKRVLQADSEWDPDQDEAGIEVSFPEDPASVNTNADFGLIQGSFICLMALFATLII